MTKLNGNYDCNRTSRAAPLKIDQQPLALVNILAVGQQQIEQGRVIPATDAIARIRQRAASAKTDRESPQKPC